MKNILLATGNPHKVEKLSWIVEDFFDRIETFNNYPLSVVVEENGQTFEENAIEKAVTYSHHYDGYTIATDGGVTIPALGDQWNGLYTKRFAGEQATDEERIKLLLEMMKDKTGDQRTMIWREAIAIAYDGKLLFSTEVEGVRGVLRESYNSAHYKPGIWVCSVWFFPEYNKNFFEMTESEQEYVESSWHKLRAATQKYLAKLWATTS